MKKILIVEGMLCSHCVNAITSTLKNLKGMHSVTVDLNNKTVTVDYDEANLSLDTIKHEIEEQGYEIP